jgi:hypothetical protein
MPDFIKLPGVKPAMDAEACLKHLDGPFVTTEELLHAVVDVLRSQLSAQTASGTLSSRTPPPPPSRPSPPPSLPSRGRSSEDPS